MNAAMKSTEGVSTSAIQNSTFTVVHVPKAIIWGKTINHALQKVCRIF